MSVTTFEGKIWKPKFKGRSLVVRELIGNLKVGNVWVFVQLILGPCWPMNQLNKNPIISYFETSDCKRE